MASFLQKSSTMNLNTLIVSIAAAVLSFPIGASAQDAAAGKAKAEACAACHGADGNSPAGAFPNLAGQTARYLYIQLRDFKGGQRKNAMMTPVVANLSKTDMFDLGAWYASQPLKSTGFKADPAKVARGKKVSEDALCTMCHLGGFAGQNEVPRVSGQHYEYILAQLMAFKNKERTNDAGNMQSVMRNISDEDIEALSHYIADIN